MTSQSAPDLSRRLFTVDEYHRLTKAGILTDQDRVELIHGELIEMSPINSPHADCVDKLTEWFILHFHGQAVTRIQNPITIDDHSEPEPDLVLARLKEAGYRENHPAPQDVLLVVEVADSSLEKDRQVKLPMYAAAGIPEAWLINLEAISIEVHTHPSPQGYAQIRIFRPGETLETPAVKNLIVADILN